MHKREFTLRKEVQYTYENGRIVGQMVVVRIGTIHNNDEIILYGSEIKELTDLLIEICNKDVEWDV